VTNPKRPQIALPTTSRPVHSYAARSTGPAPGWLAHVNRVVDHGVWIEQHCHRHCRKRPQSGHVRAEMRKRCLVYLVGGPCLAGPSREILRGVVLVSMTMNDPLVGAVVRRTCPDRLATSWPLHEAKGVSSASMGWTRPMRRSSPLTPSVIPFGSPTGGRPG
jgi:hypothetical protein